MTDPRSRLITIMFIPDEGGEQRTFRLSYARLRIAAAAGVAVALAIVVMSGSWFYLASRASRVAALEATIETMSADRLRIERLTRRLEGIEDQYGAVRDLFGSTGSGSASEVWLPPSNGSRRGRGAETLPARGASLPTTWPLAEKGLVTQALLEGAAGEHPGLDIAVPSDSYILAAGGGTVVDAGEDEVYGRFVVIDHGDGYSTLYGHASLHLVERGRMVRPREVIALSGSTGRSTAPHLHFEILLNGAAVDPLSMLVQPQ